MSKIWFTSDWHLGHTNITGPKVSSWNGGYRDFDNVSDMNQTIIQTINKYVKYDDVIYNLGDFSFGGHQNLPNYRDQIHCQTIHLLRGNHDEKVDLYKDKFTSINDTLTVKFGKHTFFMSHYSHRVWLGSHKGIIHLYGHSHDSIPDYGKSMDIGIDVAKRLTGEYRPFCVEEIIQMMDKKEIKLVDHHDHNTNIR